MIINALLGHHQPPNGLATANLKHKKEPLAEPFYELTYETIQALVQALQ